jgi:biopolymer transport protein ExbD
MRRFSQRSHLVTLSEINITPLLDLAFVLLIIFVITTPLLEQSINLKLPTGGQPDRPPDKRDIANVEIAKNGAYYFEKRQISLADLERSLVNANRVNPNTIVFIRADEDGLNKHMYAVIDRCLRNGITRFSLRTEPPGSRR